MDAFRNPEFWDATQGARSAEHETVHEVRREFENPRNAAMRPENGIYGGI